MLGMQPLAQLFQRLVVDRLYARLTIGACAEQFGYAFIAGKLRLASRQATLFKLEQAKLRIKAKWDAIIFMFVDMRRKHQQKGTCRASAGP
ncbi:hypothetical protein GCM10027343_43640 [Noviherbaspirillum agri]